MKNLHLIRDTAWVFYDKYLVLIDPATGKEVRTTYLPQQVGLDQEFSFNQGATAIATVNYDYISVSSTEKGLITDTVVDLEEPHCVFGKDPDILFCSSGNRIFQRTISTHSTKSFVQCNAVVKGMYWLNSDGILAAVTEKKSGFLAVVFLDMNGTVIGTEELLADWVGFSEQRMMVRDKRRISILPISWDNNVFKKGRSSFVSLSFLPADSSLRVSPNGRYLAVKKKTAYEGYGPSREPADSAGYIFFYDMVNGRRHALSEYNNAGFEFNSKDQLLYFSDSLRSDKDSMNTIEAAELVLFDPVRTSHLKIQAGSMVRDKIVAFDYNAASKRLAFEMNDHTIAVVDLVHGWKTFLPVLPRTDGLMEFGIAKPALKFSPSGRFLVSYREGVLRTFVLFDSLRYNSSVNYAISGDELIPTEADGIFLLKATDGIYQFSVYSGERILKIPFNRTTKPKSFNPYYYQGAQDTLIDVLVCNPSLVLLLKHATITKNFEFDFGVKKTKGAEPDSNGRYTILEFHDMLSGNLIKTLRADKFIISEQKGKKTKNFFQVHFPELRADRVLRCYSNYYIYDISMDSLSFTNIRQVEWNSTEHHINFRNSGLILDLNSNLFSLTGDSGNDVLDIFAEFNPLKSLRSNIAFIDSNRFFMLSGSGVLELNEIKSASHKLSILSYSSGLKAYHDLLTVSHYGFFDGNSRALTQFYWRNADQYYAFGSYYNSFYSPGLLCDQFNQRLSYTIPPINLMIRLPGLNSMLQSGQASIVKRNGQQVICFKNAPISGPLRDPIFRVSDDESCRLYVNIPGDVDLTPVNKIPKPTSMEADYYFKQQSKGKLYVLCMAIKSYSAGANLPSLSGSLNSVDSLLGALKRYSGLIENVFDSVIILPPLLDVKATRSNFSEKLNLIARRIRPQDVLLIYMTGHGIIPPQSELFHFFCYESLNGTADEIQKTTLNTAQLADIYTDMGAMRIVLIIDACQSGGTRDSFGKLSQATKFFPSSIPSVNVSLTTSLPYQYANQFTSGSQVIGLFCNAMRSLSNNQTVSFKQLLDKMMLEYSDRPFSGQQTPVVLFNGPDFPFMKRK